MNEVEIYQTIAKHGTVEECEKHGPIFCTDNPWLGAGYYFWDGLLSNAEWWGKTHYHNDYMIFKSSYDVHSELLLDLVGNVKHIEYFQRYAHALKAVLGRKTIKVSTMIEFMKKAGNFPFQAIRVEGRNIRGSKNVMLVFDDQGMYYLQPVPKIQLCITDFDSFHIVDYKFVKASE